MNDGKPFLRAADHYVADAPLSEARRLVSEHHYAKGGSNTGVYIHGLYRRSDNALIGVAWWLPPTKNCCLSVNKRRWKKVVGLTRLVCTPDAPKNSASFLIGRSVGMIRQKRRFVSLVTFADEKEGHTGQIYRATNWDYVGKTGPYPAWEDYSGRLVARQATTSRTKAEMIALGYRQIGPFFKHKFVIHFANKKPAPVSAG